MSRRQRSVALLLTWEKKPHNRKRAEAAIKEIASNQCSGRIFVPAANALSFTMTWLTLNK